jgi:hypothetical protein
MRLRSGRVIDSDTIQKNNGKTCQSNSSIFCFILLGMIVYYNMENINTIINIDNITNIYSITNIEGINNIFKNISNIKLVNKSEIDVYSIF